MTGHGLIPDGLAQMRPGPELIAVLAKLDVAALSGPDWVEVMAAWQRIEVHAAGRRYAALAEAVRSFPGTDERSPDRATPVDDLAVTVVAAELNLTKASAARQVALAEDLTARRPELLPEMLAGRLDIPRAAAFLDITRG